MVVEALCEGDGVALDLRLRALAIDLAIVEGADPPIGAGFQLVELQLLWIARYGRQRAWQGLSAVSLWCFIGL